MTNEQREIHRKKRVLEDAERVGNVNRTCRYFGLALEALEPVEDLVMAERLADHLFSRDTPILRLSYQKNTIRKGGK